MEKLAQHPQPEQCSPNVCLFKEGHKILDVHATFFNDSDVSRMP